MDKLLIALMLAVAGLSAQANPPSSDPEKLARIEYPTDTLFKIWSNEQRSKGSALLYFDALVEKHLVESGDPASPTVKVTYFAKGSAETDYLMQSGGPDLYGLRFKRMGRSDLYFCIQDIPRDAWFSYRVNEFKKVKVSGQGDLEQTSMATIHEGSVMGPDAPLSADIEVKAETPKGLLREFVLDSKHMAESRRFQVYVPYAYDPQLGHRLVLQFDGQNYSAPGSGAQASWQAWTPMPTILDNLIHQKKIAPTVVVFIRNQGNRSGDLVSAKMTDFVALELLAWVRENYNISPNPKHVVASGPSRAGFAAAQTAFRHSKLVGGVLSQSGSFYYTLQDKENWPIYPEWEGKLVQEYKQSPRLDIDFYLDVGLYDLGLGAVGTNRQLRDILELKGYRVSYYQYKGGHSHLGWRHTLARGLISLLGEGASPAAKN